jgi:endonuclease III
MEFKRRFPSWLSVWKADRREIATAIKSGGLAKQKAGNIKRALGIIHDEFGEVSLRCLKNMKRQEAEDFLLKLPGIGVKSARCIMMYSLGFGVLPVDTHVARITYRLGWVNTQNTERLHAELERLVPSKWRFCFHVCCVQHGRAICRGQYPKCDVCCLARVCKKVGITDNRKSA